MKKILLYIPYLFLSILSILAITLWVFINPFSFVRRLKRFVSNAYRNDCYKGLEGDIEKLKEYAQNENWSMVEIQAEKISYIIE